MKSAEEDGILILLWKRNGTRAGWERGWSRDGGMEPGTGEAAAQPLSGRRSASMDELTREPPLAASACFISQSPTFSPCFLDSVTLPRTPEGVQGREGWDEESQAAAVGEGCGVGGCPLPKGADIHRSPVLVFGSTPWALVNPQ